MNITFIGGPCHGQDYQTPREPAVGSVAQCGGYDYRYAGGARFYAVGPAGSAGGVGGSVPGEKQVYLAWSRLMRAMSTTVPHHVRQSAKARARIKRVVR